jgi:hypothetical protein
MYNPRSEVTKKMDEAKKDRKIKKARETNKAKKKERNGRQKIRQEIEYKEEKRHK